jgi:hypothetical protein
MGRPHELLQFANFDFRVERDDRGYYSINWGEYQEFLKEGSEGDMPAVPEAPLLGRTVDDTPIHVSVAQYFQSHRNDAVFNTLLKHQEYVRRVLDQVSQGMEISEPTLLTIFEHAPRMHNAVSKIGEKFEEVIVAEEYFDIPYWDLQRLYFRDEISLLRRCFQCQKFFFDESEEKKLRFCSASCEGKGVEVWETLPEKAKVERRELLEKVARGEGEDEEALAGKGGEEGGQAKEES